MSAQNKVPVSLRNHSQETRADFDRNSLEIPGFHSVIAVRNDKGINSTYVFKRTNTT